ncbi:MAG: hypothetical protein RI911_803 [Candidatus Parcubacteria bacterium]
MSKKYGVVFSILLVVTACVAEAQRQNPFQNLPCISLKQTIRRGDTDALTKGSVSALQLFLATRAELSTRQATQGVLDSHTADVLLAYQKKVGITEDGVGAATLKHIQSICTVNVEGAKTYKQLIKVGDLVDTLSSAMNQISNNQKQKKPLPSAPSVTSYRAVIGFTEKFQGTASGSFQKMQDSYGDIFYKTDASKQKTCVGFKLEQKNAIVDEYVAIWTKLGKYKTCTLSTTGTWVAFELSTPHLKAPEDKTKSAPLTEIPLKGDFFVVAKGKSHSMHAYGTIDTNTFTLSEQRPVSSLKSMLEAHFELTKKFPISVTPQPVATVFLATKSRFLSSVTRVPGHERVLYVSDATGTHYCIAVEPEIGKSYRSWGCPFAATLPKTHMLIMQR